jgi:cobalt-zinc-cadmium efflux system membrane fusion protein
MKGKTILLLVIVALGGITLGAWGMQQFGSWGAVFQTMSAWRPSTRYEQTSRSVATGQQTAHAEHEEHDEHEHHEHAEDTPGQHPETPGANNDRTHTHEHNEGQPAPAKVEGPRLAKANPPAQKKDPHQHGADRQGHGKEPGRQANAKNARSARTDAHGHGDDEHGHGEAKLVRMPVDKAQQLGIEMAVARAGSLQTQLTLPGTVTLNSDRLVHVVSRIPGIVQEIRKNLGDAVRAGEVMAVIDSRELADAKATYLAARERLSLAESTFAREKDLWEKQIAPEQDYLTAKQALAEVRIELQVAAHKLRALGFAETYVQQLASRANAPLTRYEVVAPLAGTVIEKHLAVGEVLKDDTEAFVVADLSTVWVDLNVPVNSLLLVKKGQRVVVEVNAVMPKAEGTIHYVGPMVSEETRTAVTRVVLPNPDGRWRPGLFVTATIAVGDTPVTILIPKTALQTVDSQPTVFVQTPEGFAPRPVTLGRSNETHAEITAGLQAGERYATTETFVLKADLGKGSASHEH